jgi:hypothetical protein
VVTETRFTPSDTRQLCQRMTTEAREARVTTLQFVIALAVVVTGLVMFACALMLI